MPRYDIINYNRGKRIGDSMDLGEQFHIDLQNLKSHDNLVIKGNKYRITVLTERLIRLEYNKEGKFNDLATELVVNRNFNKALFEVRQDSNFVEITTNYFKLEYNKEASFKGSAVNASKNLRVMINGNAEQMWYYGHPEVRNYFGSSISAEDLKNNEPKNKGLYSLDGFVSIDDSNTLRLDSNGNYFAPNSESIDMYLFVYGKDFGFAIQDYFKLTGMPALIPRYVLGNWWCRDKAYNDVDVLNIANSFEEHNIPLSVFLLDKDWHLRSKIGSKTSKTGYTFNPNLFPDPSGMIKELHEKGIKVGLNINPSEGIYPSEQYYQQIREYLGGEENKVIPFQALNSKFLDVYFKVLIHSLESFGVDFFWNDYDNIKDLTSLWVLTHYHYHDLARIPARRGMLLARNSLKAAHRYGVLYSGNTKVGWENFKTIPFYNLSASNIGVCWWSHDIGGYSGGIEDPELYIRSVQLGTFSPILRFHSSGGRYYKRKPWLWDKKTSEIVDDYLRLRHQFMTYLYTEAYRYSTTGTMVFQPLYYLLPKIYDDPLYRNEYLFGSELLVAPITNKKDTIMNRTIHRFYLPQGIWYDYFTGKKYIGNKKYVAFYKEEDYPVFAKSGSIIPLSLRSNVNNTDIPRDMEIQVFPGKNNVYTLYEDDGISSMYKSGYYFKTIIDYNYLPSNYTLIIRPKEGKSGIVPDRRNYRIVFRNTKKAEDVIVRFNNEEIAFNSYIESSNFIVEVENIDILGQLTINCKGADIEIDAVRIINEDIDSILSDLQIETIMKEKISDIIFSNNEIKDKRIALRKLKKQGLDKTFIQLFIKLLEYIGQI